MIESRRQGVLKMEEAAGIGGFSQVSNVRRLLKLRRDAVELRIQAGADRVHGRNDHDRNASSDEAILDRGGEPPLLLRLALAISGAIEFLSSLLMHLCRMGLPPG